MFWRAQQINGRYSQAKENCIWLWQEEKEEKIKSWREEGKKDQQERCEPPYGC